MTSVALIHVPTAEISFLRNVFQVMAARGLPYEIATTAEQMANAEIVVVDTENAIAMQLWIALQMERPGATGILVTKRPPPDDGQLWIQRPFTSLKIFTALGKADLQRNPTRQERRAVQRKPEPHLLRGSRVLVIDDSATVRKYLELTLGDQGIHVQTADNGELGLHLLATQNFDLIFLGEVADNLVAPLLQNGRRRERAKGR